MSDDDSNIQGDHDANNKDDSNVMESDASITALARKEFDRPEDFQWAVATPIVVRNLSLQKDETSGCCTEHPKNENGTGLQTAPNFASAVLGKWLASKIGLNGPPPVPPSTAAGTRSNDDNNGHVFSNVSALLMPGESTLLLGPSSSGKTTLLQTLCDKISGKTTPNVEGTLLLGSIDPSESKQNLTRTAAFCDQTDLTLTPILTVEETVRFARSCAESDRDDMEERMDAIFRLAGLDHVKKTVVGDADVRGVSGGQKRRVKLLEMAVGSEVRFFALDEITNGLDATTALEICKLVRVAVETQGLASVTTLLQPSPEVFHTFHRLILLTQDGQVAYSGKTAGAMSHFESLGLVKPNEMSEAEFLLRCATEPTAFWDSGGDIPNTISSSAELASSFHNSEAGSLVLQELEQAEARDAKERSERSTSGLNDEKSIAGFAHPIHRQILLLMGRGFKLVARNPASVQRVLLSIVFGAFIGTLFLNTGSDAAGTTVRAGYGELAV